MNSFVWSIRVYYEDTDAGGVVYHSSYLNFMERARTELLRQVGIDQTDLCDQQHILFVVHDLHIQYIKPARLNDVLHVTSQITRYDRCSLTFEQCILRKEKLLTRATVGIACLHAHHFKPVRIPDILKTHLLEFTRP